MPNMYLALVHYPIRNKRQVTVTTSVTNLDIHDIARSCRTFGMKKYFIVTPVKAQHELIGKILGHWDGQEGNEYNPDRSDALSIAHGIDSVEKAMEEIEKIEGKKPLLTVTGANFKEYDGNTDVLMKRLEEEDRPLLILFGTGWGLADSILEQADFKLNPIFGISEDGYNHLSVRSAVAIYMDRIAGSIKNHVNR